MQAAGAGRTPAAGSGTRRRDRSGRRIRGRHLGDRLMCLSAFPRPGLELPLSSRVTRTGSAPAKDGRDGRAQAPRPATCGGMTRGSEYRLEVGLVLRPHRPLRLEEQHDLRPGVRDAVVGSLDHVPVREPDSFVTAVDPGVAVGGLAEDVEQPAPRGRLSHHVWWFPPSSVGARSIGQTSPGPSSRRPGRRARTPRVSRRSRRTARAAPRSRDPRAPCAPDRGRGRSPIRRRQTRAPARPRAVSHLLGPPCIPEAQVGLERPGVGRILEPHPAILAHASASPERPGPRSSPTPPPGCPAAISTASSRLPHSRMSNPPIASLVSATGRR